LFRLLNRLEAGRCSRRESELVRRAVVTTAVSSRDLEALGAGPRGRVVTVAGGVENGGQPAEPRKPVVLLSGNLGYAPTVRAARWFADRVWPGVRAKVPGATWILAGARPAPDVKRLAARPGVEIHGDVDDLAPFLAQAAVGIAPMASGSGVPIKILEAMAAGVPVVADPWSAAGLVDPRAVATAGGEAEWIETIRGLLTDHRAAGALAARALQVWQTSYHPDVVKSQIREAVEAAMREPL
jgi:glycosyltransferase involved in cell wall biosynthesis